MRAHKHLHEHHHGHSCGHDHDHNHDHHDCGHNHGFLGQIAHDFSTKAAVANEAIGNKFGGRENSGRVGRATRVVRGISNATAVGIGVAGVVAVGTSVASGGLAAPLWILIGGGVAVAANLAAVGIGSGANHLKISQYYDALVEINAENGRLLKLNGEEPGTLPHGIMEYWEKDRKLFKMTVKRRGQEVVSVAGTAMSGALMLSAFGALAIAPSTAVGLFFASRSISVGTAAGSAYNTRDRLNIYKEILYRFGQQYIEVTGKRDSAKQTQALKIVADVFTKLNIPTNVTDITNDQQWRTFNIAHSVYRMLFTQSENLSQTDRLAFLNPHNQQQVVDGLVARLQPLIKEDRSFWSGHTSRYFGRTALRKLDAGNQYTVGGELAVLDAMPILAMQLETGITGTLIGRDATARAQTATSQIISDLNINVNKDDPQKTLAFSIRKAVVQGISAGHENAAIIAAVKDSLRTYLKAETAQVEVGRKWGGLRAVYGERNTGRLILDTLKLSGAFSVQGHAHGSDFLPYYHLSRLADIITAAATGQRRVREEHQHHSHNHGHEKCSGHHHHDHSAHKEESIKRPLLQSHSGHHNHDHTSCSGHHHHKHSEQKHTAHNPPSHSRHGHSKRLHQHHVAATSHQAQPLNVNHHAEHSYNILKESLNYAEPLTTTRIKKQQENLDSFRQYAEKFILVRTFKDGQGNTIYLWDNPDYLEQKEYQITYIVNDRTGKMAVKYGTGYLQESSPIAVVAADSNIRLGVGVRLLEIGRGQHIALGDTSNSLIDVAASGLSITHTDIARATSHKHHHHSHACRHRHSMERDRESAAR